MRPMATNTPSTPTLLACTHLWIRPEMNPPIALVWLPGMSYDEEGVPMWDTVPDQD